MHAMMQTRPESGPMQFGDDWTGVFLRGDCAGPFAMSLRSLLLMMEKGVEPHPITVEMIRNLARALEYADERGNYPGAQVQKLKPWKECLP